METIYLVCAVFGATLWITLFVMSLLGGDHGVDSADGVDAHAGAGGHVDHGFPWLMGLFSIRSIITGITFFGVGGLVGSYNHVSPPQSFGMAAICALAAMALTAAAVRLLLHTTHDGTLHIRNAVGKVGTVYLRIPGNSSGRGKVTVKVQERLVEFQAVCQGPELPTGAQVVVVNVVGPDTVEVIPAII